MNSISFNGAYHSNLNPQNNEKKGAKKIAAAAIITTGAVVGGVALYKNRNSKPVQKALAFAKDNIISPLKKVGNALKKKTLETINSIKTSVKSLNAKKEKAPVEDLAANTAKNTEAAIQTPKKAKERLGRKINGKVKKGAKGKIKTNTEAIENLKAEAVKIESKQTDIPKKGDFSHEIVLPGAPVDGKPNGILNLAKQNADKLRTAGAGVAAGAVVGTGAMGLVDKINENKQLKDEKFIIKMNGKEFKGTFKGEDGKAHDENGELLNGKVVVVYNGNSGKEFAPGEKVERILKKTIMQYEDGILKKATHFDDIDDKVPAHIKKYENGKINTVLKDLVLTDGKKGVKPNKTVNFGVKNSWAMMNTKKYVDEEGREVIEFYKRNEDKDGKIIGKPIHTYTMKKEKLTDGGTKTSFYAEPKKFGVIDRILKTIETKPDGKTEITLSDRSMEFDNSIGKMYLDEDNKITKYELIVPGDMYDPRSPNGYLIIEDGKIVNQNDDMTAWGNGKKLAEQHPELDEQFGNYGLACFQDANLKIDTLVRGTYFDLNDGERFRIDESYVGKDGDTRVGVVHNDDGTIKAIAAYYGVDHHIESDSMLYPDCVTFFENGKPAKDIHYSEDDAQIFTSNYNV